MPEVSLIETSEIPTIDRGGASLRTDLAAQTIRRACEARKSVRVTLKPEDRASGILASYKAAAHRLGIGLVVTYGPARTYTNKRGTVAQESSVLYFSFKRKPATEAAPIEAAR